MKVRIVLNKKTGRKYFLNGRCSIAKVTVYERMARYSVVDGGVISMHPDGHKVFLAEFVDVCEPVELTEELIKEINAQ